MDFVEIEVELHSTEPSAVEAVKRTFAQAPLNSELVEKEGKFFLRTGNPGFIRFAAVSQGYVKRVAQ